MKHFFGLTIEYANSQERDQILDYLNKNNLKDWKIYEDFYESNDQDTGFVEIRDISLSVAKVIEDELNLD